MGTVTRVALRGVYWAGSSHHAANPESPLPATHLSLAAVRRLFAKLLFQVSRTRSRPHSRPRCSSLAAHRDKRLPGPLGPVLPSGLGWNSSFFACASASRPSLPPRFTPIPKCRLALWRFAGNRRTGHQQLSPDDCDQQCPQPHKALRLDRSLTQLQHLFSSQFAGSK
jgi:hypothetical protein